MQTFFSSDILRSFIISLLWISLLFSWPSEEAEARTCNAILTQYIEGAVVKVREVEEPSDGGREVNYSFIHNGEAIARFEVSMERDRVTFIDFIVKEPRHRRRGISHRFLEKLFNDYPRINSIEATLVSDNLAAFHKKLSIFPAINDVTLKSALRNTPFYKALRPYGFNRIEFIEVNRNHVELVVDRESNPVKRLIQSVKNRVSMGEQH